jgi:hypothetical protein
LREQLRRRAKAEERSQRAILERALFVACWALGWVLAGFARDEPTV